MQTFSFVLVEKHPHRSCEQKHSIVFSDFLLTQDLMGIEVGIVVQMAFSCPFFFFLTLGIRLPKIFLKIDHEAISFSRSGGKKVDCVDGKTTHVT